MNSKQFIDIRSANESLSQVTRMSNYTFAASLRPPASDWRTAAVLRELFSTWNHELKKIGEQHKEFSKSYLNFVEAIERIDTELAQELRRADESLTR